jgi:hypothetical protein
VRIAVRHASGGVDIMMSACKNQDVRTTLTIEEDVGVQLRQEMRRSGRPLKQVVNEFLRLGLERRASAAAPKPFKVRPFPAGPPAGMTFDHVEELIDYLEGPAHR